MSLRDVIIDLLKFVSALAVIAGVTYYWLTQGPPPRGKGRWREVLRKLKDRFHDEPMPRA